MIKLTDKPLASTSASGDYIFINRNGTIMQVARNELFNNTMSAPPIVPSATGNVIPLTDSSDRPFVDLTVFGSTTQNGTPTPENPIDLDNVENPTVTINGKNLVENTATTKTVNGVTFTVNSDGSVTANGTASENATASIRTCDSITLPIGTYILSGCPSGGGSTTYDIRYSASGGRDTGSGTTITITEPTEIYVAILIRSGVTVDNLVFKPMIRLASISDSTYEPYKSQTLSVPYTLNGVGEVKDYVDFERGVLVKNCKEIIVDGTNVKLSLMSSFDDNGETVLQVMVPEKDGISPYGLCSHLERNTNLWAVYPYPHFLMSNEGGNDKRYFRAYFKGYADIDSLNASFATNPMTIIYPSTQTETPLTAEEIEAFKQLHTYYPTTTITNSENAEMGVEYVADTKNYIDQKLASLVASATTTDTTEV